MATIIQVTPELLRSKATDVRNLRAEHDEVMTRLSTLIHALNEEWKGAAQDALVAKYDGMQTTFSNFSELLEQFATLMDASATNLENADITSANQTNNS